MQGQHRTEAACSEAAQLTRRSAGTAGASLGARPQLRGAVLLQVAAPLAAPKIPRPECPARATSSSQRANFSSGKTKMASAGERAHTGAVTPGDMAWGNTLKPGLKCSSRGV